MDNDSPTRNSLPYYPPNYLTAQQMNMLMFELHKARVMEHQGNSYLATWDVRAMLTRVFGFARWSEQGTQPTTLVYAMPITLSNGKDGMAVAYQAHRRLIVCAPSGMELAAYDGSSVGKHRMPMTSLGDCHDNAVKTAESGALKRAAINLGTQFGLGLYDHGRTDEVVRVLAWDPRPARDEQPSTPGTAVVVGGNSDLRTEQEARREAEHGDQPIPVRQVGRTVTMPPETAADLRAAATLMRQRGQCWDTYEDDQGHVCSRGALLLAISGDPHPVHRGREHTAEEQTRIRKAEQAYRAANGTSTVRWHDNHEGEPEACLAAMERAAEGVVQ